MRVRDLHRWDMAPREAMALQTRLAPQVVREGNPGDVRLVAAADLAFLDRPLQQAQEGTYRRSAKGGARAAVVVLSYPDLAVVEQHVVETLVSFPYVPGLLSFREIPALAQAFAMVQTTPDLLLVDGQGYAHPRRFGIACHLGLLLDIPAIGCAKSRLCGEEATPGPAPGTTTELIDKGEVIGLVLRTREGVRPVYVSVGHRIGLESAAAWVLRLCRGYRLPEPIRLADRLSKGQ